MTTAATIAESIKVDVPRSITRAQVIEVATVLGLDPHRLASLTISHGEVTAVVKVSAPSGGDLLAWEDGGRQVVKRVLSIPVLDDEAV
jgi:hypothetical protein